MDIDQLMSQAVETANYCRAQGQYVKINHGLPWVDVFHGLNDHGDRIEYFFQGDEASDLIDECPEFLNVEDYILWVSQGW